MVRDVEFWDDMTVYQTNLAGISRSSKRALFYRERNSHKGIHTYKNLEKLGARFVNQSFLEEIYALENLQYLAVDDVTAVDLSPLRKLRKLTVLKIHNLRKINDFRDLAQLTTLKSLYICNAKHLTTLEFLSECHHLQRLGVEGSMWTAQNLQSLAPLSELRGLEELFMTNVRLTNKDLSFLSQIPNLKALDCARFAPKTNFKRLRELMPDLICHWCDKYEIDPL